MAKKLSQFADDLSLFLRNKIEVCKVVRIIKDFTTISRKNLFFITNINKSTLFSIKYIVDKKICGIPVKDTVTYLVVIISKDDRQRSNLNFHPFIDKIKAKYNLWLIRDHYMVRCYYLKQRGYPDLYRFLCLFMFHTMLLKTWKGYYRISYGGIKPTI